MSPVSLTNPGNVVGIDCGGENCPPCSTCDDGIRNAHWVRDPNLRPDDLGKDSVGRDENGMLYRLVMEKGIDCGFPCDSACAPTCNDGILNGLEENVDCGGPDCPPCPEPPNCFDGVRNGPETGIDCGADYCPLDRQACPDPSCTDGIQNIHIELTTAVQEGYLLVVETGIDCDQNPFTSCPDCPVATCFDGIKNGIEEGVDCGGNCGTACTDAPDCHDGVQNGNETGIDCGGDCPPCATCDDGFKNGPELDVDCVDYPIPQYTQSDGTPCPLCPSCHDGIQNEELLELDVDCGNSDCGPCEQYLQVGVIDIDGFSSSFVDQFWFNSIQAQFGNTDTLFVENALIIENPGNAIGPGGNPIQRRQIVGTRHIVTSNGTFETKVTVVMARPSSLQVGENYDVVPANQNTGQLLPVGVKVEQRFLDGEGAEVFEPTEFVTAPNELGDPNNPQMSIEYNYINVQNDKALIRGSINFARLRKPGIAIPGQPNPQVTVSNIDFAIQYNPLFH